MDLTNNVEFRLVFSTSLKISTRIAILYDVIKK